MAPRKVVLHSFRGCRADFDVLVASWIERASATSACGVRTPRIEDCIDEVDGEALGAELELVEF